MGTCGASRLGELYLGGQPKGWGSVDGTLPSESASSMPRLSWCGAGKGT